MLRTLIVTVVAFLPLSAHAQFGVSSVSFPIRPDRAPLAHANEVPDVLLLGLGGPTASLVNPARAARLRDRFAYGTLTPQNEGLGPISFAGLVGTRDRRWLIVADNSVYSDENTQSFLDRRTDDLPSDGTRIFESEQVRESSRTDVNAGGRVLLVGRTDFGGYAFGLFGGYRGANQDAFQTVASLTEETVPTPPISDVREQANEQTRRQHRDDFGVGVEVALAGRTWDLATSLSYQRRTADAAIIESELTTRDFEDPTTTLVLDDQRSSSFSAEASPQAVDFEVIGALRTGDRRDDYLFGAVSGTFGGGTADYSGVSSTSRLFVQENNGEVVFEESSSSTFEDAGEMDLDTRATCVSLGYVFARRHRGFTVLAALNPSADYEQVDRANTGPFFASEEEVEQLRIALNLPLYVRFDVSKRLEVFGGGVYSYTYLRTDLTERPLYPIDLVGDDQTIEITNEWTNDTFASDSRFFAGALLTLRSGFAAQAAFNGDLANLNGWTVSLGYRF